MELKDNNSILLYRIERSKRKSISLIINAEGELIAKAPLRMSQKQIYEFAKKHQTWIIKHIEKKKAEIKRFEDLFAFKKILFLGEEKEIVLSNTQRSTTLINNEVLLPLRQIAKLSTKEEADKKIRRLLHRWLKASADEYLRAESSLILERLGLEITAFKTINSKSKWGSCTKSGVISLNWRCIMLPNRLIEYVIVHEAIHLKELNHSKRFWLLVSNVLSDYKKRRLELKQFALLQQLFRD